MKITKISQILLYLFAILQPFITSSTFSNQNGEFYEDENFDKQNRMLKNQEIEQEIQEESQPIRIKYDFQNILKDSNISIETRDMVVHALDSAAFYVKNLLKVVPNKQPIMLDSNKQGLCQQLPVSNKILAPNSVSDTDLFIMIDGYFNSTSNNIAKSHPCLIKRRPLVGRIIINFDRIDFKKLQNKQDYLLKIFVHELIHILGFSFSIYNSWIDPLTNQPYNQNFQKNYMRQVDINGKNISTITTKLLREEFQTHFGCTNIPGMIMDGDTNNSHFLQNVIRDELMNLIIYNYQSDVTQFTVNLLKNTYFYANVNENMAIHSGWGYKRGCQYFGTIGAVQNQNSATTTETGQNQNSKTTGTEQNQKPETTGAGQNQKPGTTGTGQNQNPKTTGTEQNQKPGTTGSGQNQNPKTTGAEQNQKPVTTGSGQNQNTGATGDGQNQNPVTTGVGQNQSTGGTGVVQNSNSNQTRQQPKTIDQQCDPSGYGKYSQKYLLSGKKGLQESKNVFCTQLDQKRLGYSGEEYTHDSKCYQSSFKLNTIFNPFFSEYKNLRCFKTTCQDDGTLYLKINAKNNTEISYKCQYPSQFIEISEETISGIIRCPYDLQLYCQKKLFCQNDCSLNGFCLKGRCVCLPGFGGLDCSQKIKPGNVINQNEILSECPKGTYLNPNNVCMDDCLEGYFQVGNTCQQCNSKCKQCTGYGENQCLKCNLDLILTQGMCLQREICSKEQQEKENCLICASKTCISCKPNHYLTKDKLCQKCSPGCEQCFESSSFCTKCNTSYALSENKCIPQNQIMAGCLAVNPNNSKKCLKCNQGYTLDSSKQCQFCEKGSFYNLNNNQCEKCDSQCLTCIFESDQCTSCLEKYFLNLKENTCVPYEQQPTVEQKRNLVEVYLPEDDSDIHYYTEDNPCHYSCDQCNDKSYTECLECSQNRLFIKSKTQQINFCVCPEGSSDYGIYGCIFDQLVQEAQFAFISIIVIGLSYQIFQTIFEKASIYTLIIFIDFLQTVSYLRYIDGFYQISLDQFWQSLQFTNMFSIQVLYSDDFTEDNLNMNPKILFEQKTPYFINNTLIMILLLFVLNTIYFARSKLPFLKRQENHQKLQYLIMISNYLSIQEIVFNICSSFMLISLNKISVIINIVFGFLLLFYVIIGFAYFKKKSLNNQKKVTLQKMSSMSLKVMLDQPTALNLQCKSSQLNSSKQNSSECIQQASNANQIQLTFNDQPDQYQIAKGHDTINEQSPQQNDKTKQQKSNLQKYIGNSVIILLKILNSILFSISNKNKVAILTVITIFIVMRLLVFLRIHQMNRKQKILTILKQVQLIIILSLYNVILHSNKDATLELIIAAAMIFLTCVDYIFIAIYNIFKQILLITKYYLKKKN